MLQPWSPSRTSRRWLRRAIPTLMLGTTLLTASSASAAQPAGASDPAVITTWAQIAVHTISDPVASGGAGKANAEAYMWYSFVQGAVYNAVVGITGKYVPYKWAVSGPTTASPEAAAAAAAHRVLKNYFGGTAAVAATLDAALVTSLAKI